MSEVPSQPADEVLDESDRSGGEPDRRSSSKRWLIALLALAVVGIGTWQMVRWFQHQRGRDLVIPQLNLTGLDPAIVKTMTETRQAVEERPYDAPL